MIYSGKLFLEGYSVMTNGDYTNTGEGLSDWHADGLVGEEQWNAGGRGRLPLCTLSS